MVKNCTLRCWPAQETPLSENPIARDPVKGLLFLASARPICSCPKTLWTCLHFPQAGTAGPKSRTLGLRLSRYQFALHRSLAQAHFGTTLSLGFTRVKSTASGHNPRWEKGTPFSHVERRRIDIDLCSMERDLELVRQILLKAAAHPHGRGFSPQDDLDGVYTTEQIGYHVHLMGQAGLIAASDATTHDDPSPNSLMNSITWSGYEYLESVRDEKVWKETKSLAGRAGSTAFDLVKQIAISVAKSELAKHGVNL